MKPSTTATDQSFTLSLPSADVEISYKGHEVVQKKSPWSKTNEDIFKYKVYAVLVGKGKVLFDFHGSVHSCNAEARNLIERFKSLTDKEYGLIDRFFRFNKFPDMDYFMTISGITKENKASYRSLLQFYLDSRRKFSLITGENLYGAATLDKIRAGEFDKFAEPKFETGKDLAFMFRCIVQDATSGAMDIDEFANEFGYTVISECLAAHKACKQALTQFEELGLTVDNLNDMLNEMGEAGI